MVNRDYICNAIFVLCFGWFPTICGEAKTYQLLGNVLITQQPAVEAVVHDNQLWCVDQCFEREMCHGFSLADDGERCVLSVCETNLPIGGWKMYKMEGKF